MTTKELAEAAATEAMLAQRFAFRVSWTPGVAPQIAVAILHALACARAAQVPLTLADACRAGALAARQFHVGGVRDDFEIYLP